MCLGEGAKYEGYLYPMINKGSKPISWEPYTGGKPSPNPDYPQEIVSAGQSGQIKIDVLGGNLLPEWRQHPSGEPLKNFTIDNNVGWVVTTLNIEKGKNYYISCLENGILTSRNIYVNTLASSRDGLINANSGKFTAIKSGVLYIRVGAYGETNTYSGFIVSYSQISKIEPYKQPQSVILATPDGLPGIPVTSGGNYTDESGQQWICDEVDFKRGVYVQRLNKKILTSALPWKFSLTTGNGNNNFQIRLTSEEGATDILSGKPVISMCNFLKYAGLIWDDNEINLPKIYASALEITASFPPDSEVNSLQKWNELLDGIGNCYIYYILDIPIETHLSAEQISAYKTLHTYSPTTTVSNDAGAWMKVGYKTRKSLEVTT